MKKYIILPFLFLSLFIQAQKKVIFTNLAGVAMTVYEVGSRDTAGGLPKFVGQATLGPIAVSSTYTMSPAGGSTTTKFPFLYLHGAGSYFDSWTKYISGGAPVNMNGTAAFADAAAPTQVFDYVAVSVAGGTFFIYGLGTYSVGGYTLTISQGASGGLGTTNVTLN